MPDISHAARIYALKELSRRAGVTNEFFQCWRVEIQSDMLLVQPQPDAHGQIRFPFFSAALQNTEVVKKTWYCDGPAELRELVPDFIVPFARVDSTAGQPLFLEQSPQEFCSTEDLLASVLLTLCRFEEMDFLACDEHGRFPASASIAYRHGFLDRPIVDEYGLALQQILQVLLPGWQPARHSLRVKLSHDIDQLGIPFSLRGALGHLLKRGAPLSCARDILSLATSVEPCYLNLVRTICSALYERGIHSALYWKASAAGPFDTGYDVSDPRIASVVQWARARGVEMGVHPGYETFLSLPQLEQEVQRCQMYSKTSGSGDGNITSDGALRLGPIGSAAALRMTAQ